MKRTTDQIAIEGLIGRCGQRQVFLGFAPAHLLYSISFADLLNEDTEEGYQRRFNDKHSIDFRNYIQGHGSSTIPLTFNLRPRHDGAWKLNQRNNRGTVQRATLIVRSSAEKVLAQVDCQHRLGYLSNLDVPLAFMTFIGLNVKEEMRIFTVINSKAKGLNSSLLDYNDARLADDLGKEKPELLIAIHLNEHSDSPWQKQLDLGGNSTSGINRRASLRTIQKSVKHFLRKTEVLKHRSPTETAEIVRYFWKAVVILLEEQWAHPRKHLVTKGIGVYCLMNLASDLYLEAIKADVECSQSYFISALSEFIGKFDWTTTGPLKGLGGEAGVSKATDLLRELRRKRKLKVVNRGR